jgi:hypothetical protein
MREDRIVLNAINPGYCATDLNGPAAYPIP